MSQLSEDAKKTHHVMYGNRFLADVLNEEDRQDAIWGANRDQDWGFWLIIMLEELGEVARAILKRDWDNMREEIIHTLAVGFQFLENIERKK